MPLAFCRRGAEPRADDGHGCGERYLVARLWTAIEADLATVAMAPAASLRREQREGWGNPRADPLGTAADALRGRICACMATLPGQAKYTPAFAADDEFVGPGATVQDYLHHLRRVRIDRFADELQVVELATRLRLRIICVSAAMPDPVEHNPANVGNDRTIILGNNNKHYVWLRPSGESAAVAPLPRDPSSPAKPSGDGDPMVVDQEGGSDVEMEIDSWRWGSSPIT